ncbi:MAG: hypothetical protein LBR20_04790 [Propionibacteriaceae bacterium]|jgi:hypothetical protein|nr:hypothetical protein [Propionibacteriaceae bacterium]
MAVLWPLALLCSLLVPMVAPTVTVSQAAAPDYAQFQVVYQINDFSYKGNPGYPASSTIYCVDFNQYPNDNDPSGKNQCTLRQALTQTYNTSIKTLITIDVKQFANDYKTEGCFASNAKTCQGAYRNTAGAPAININPTANSDLMCTEAATTPTCGDYDAEDGRSAYDIATAFTSATAWLEIDFQGQLGISTWNDAIYYSTFYMRGSQVKVKNINGLHATETDIIIGPGATDLEFINGTSEVYLATDSFKWSDGWPSWRYNYYAPERFMVIQGSHAKGRMNIGIRVENWATGHLYSASVVNGYGIVFDSASVSDMTIDNFHVYSGLSGSCATNDTSSCYNSGIYATGTTRLTNITVSNSRFDKFKLDMLPINLASANTSVDGLTLSNNYFGSSADTSVYSIISFASATVQNVTMTSNTFENTKVSVSAINLASAKVATLTMTSNTMQNITATGSAVNFGSATVSDLSMTSNIFQVITTTVAGINFGSAAITNITMTSNTFEKITTSANSIISFLTATNNTEKNSKVTLTSNRFLSNVGYTSIVGFYNATAFWYEITLNTFDSNYITIAEAATSPNYGGQLIVGTRGYFLDANHTSLIKGNTFTNTTASTPVNQTAIFWKGGVINDTTWTSTPDSHLQILGNTFKNYTGPAIYLRYTGGVRVQYNQFYESNAHAAKGSEHPYFQGENVNPDTANAFNSARYLVLDGQANKQVYTWNASAEVEAAYSQYACWAQVEFLRVSSTTPVPYVIDVYASETEGVLGQPIASQVIKDTTTAGMDFTFLLKDVAGKYLRTQVTSYADKVYQSSQYSTAVYVPDVKCAKPAYTVVKKAYTDSNYRVEIPVDAVLRDGDAVYWEYTVTNQSTSIPESLIVNVTDDHMPTSQDPNQVVCSVAVAPGGSTTCRWSGRVYPEAGT